jgi:N-acetylglucosamine kinase-like BadF-type ATPase
VTVEVEHSATARSLVIDGGKSKTAAATVDGEGRVLTSVTGPGLAMIGEIGGREALTDSLATTLGMLGVSGESFDTAVFGLNGVHAPSPDAIVAAAVLGDLVSMK